VTAGVAAGARHPFGLADATLEEADAVEVAGDGAARAQRPSLHARSEIVLPPCENLRVMYAGLLRRPGTDSSAVVF